MPTHLFLRYILAILVFENGLIFCFKYFYTIFYLNLFRIYNPVFPPFDLLCPVSVVYCVNPSPWLDCLAYRGVIGLWIRFNNNQFGLLTPQTNSTLVFHLAICLSILCSLRPQELPHDDHRQPPPDISGTIWSRELIDPHLKGFIEPSGFPQQSKRNK